MGLFLVVLYLIALYVRPQDWMQGFVGVPTGFVILIPALMVSFAQYRLHRNALSVPQYGLLIAYLVIIFVSTMLEPGLDSALEQTKISAKRIAVYFVIAWSLTSERHIRTVVWLILLLTLFLAFQAFLQAATGVSWGEVTPMPGYSEIRVRWHGDWDGPNVFALLFIIAIGFSIELIFGTYGIGVRVMGAALTSTYFLAIFWTNSRGAILAVAAMLVFYFHNRFKRTAAIILAVVCVAGVVAFGPSRMSEVSSKESSAHERTWLWEQGLTLLRENPVFGVGRNQFYRRVDSGLLAHNNYVQSFAELGLSGFFLFMMVFWFSFKGAHLAATTAGDGAARLASYGRMLNTAMVGYAAATFFVVMELDLHYFLLGLATATYLVARRANSSIPVLAVTKTEVLKVGSAMAGIIGLIWVAAVLQVL